MHHDEIVSICQKFRNALEELPIDRFRDSSFFEHFPSGCCGDTSHLLAKYFKDNGMSPYYVCGWKGRQSHAWVEVNGVTIDITADQFNEIDEKVIVTNNSKFHKGFEERERYLSDFDSFDERSSNRYWGLYNYVLNEIKEY